jgi:hypothetical protein
MRLRCAPQATTVAAIRRVGEALLAQRAEIAQGWLLESSMIVGASCCGPRRASAFEWIRARCRTALALLQRTNCESEIAPSLVPAFSQGAMPRKRRVGARKGVDRPPSSCVVRLCRAHAFTSRAIGTGGPCQYHNPLQTPANRLHLARQAYQKKSCKSVLSHGFSRPSENRGVPGSIPGLAISGILQPAGYSAAACGCVGAHAAQGDSSRYRKQVVTWSLTRPVACMYA